MGADEGRARRVIGLLRKADSPGVRPQERAILPGKAKGLLAELDLVVPQRLIDRLDEQRDARTGSAHRPGV